MPTVATIGLHIVDLLGRPVSEIPTGQGIAFLDEIHMSVAGTCAATAMDLAKLGISVRTFGLVGDDQLGRWLRTELGETGVDTAGLLTTAEVPTSATMLPIRPNGERPALHVRGANALITEALIDWHAVSRCTHLHVGGTSLLPGIDGDATGRILRRAREAGLTTSLDLIYDPAADYEALLGPCYQYLDFFLPNDEDALEISRTDDIRAAAEYFLARGVRYAAITLGARGALLADQNGGRAVIPAYQVDVVDTSGCGDAFSAGLIAGIVRGLAPQDAVEWGVACGSLVATGLGSDAGIVDEQQVRSFMSNTPRSS